MCGIVGIFNFKTAASVETPMVKAMTDTIVHRGPDEYDIHVDNAVGLGFTRLSIIDVEHGHQPMSSRDGRYTLVFNGEIYNYQSLRQTLLDQGYEFRTNSDTEVLLALFETGVESPESQLRGMFAFALYDKATNELVLSRDCVGKKPLFWTETADGLLFGSEIKALLATNQVERRPNWAAISDFLTLSYIPLDQTAFEGIHHVQPGSRLVIKDGIQSVQWWKAPSYPESEKAQGLDYQQMIHERLQESVKLRLISDVPIGVFSSSGVDSALILSLISECGFPEQFTAYTVGFDNPDFDETQGARELAERFGIRHESIHMKAEDMERIFADVVYKSDNLLANPAIFANYLLSERANSQVKAVLHGGGADELFFGYETYKADMMAARLKWLPKWTIDLMEWVAQFLPASYTKLGFKYKVVKFLQGLHFDPEKQHYWWRTIFTEQDKDRLLNADVPRHDSFSAYKRAFIESESDEFLESAAYADRQVWWGAMGLYQGDTMSMANSLELRMPFMDKALIESMAKIPLGSKFKDGKLKLLLKQICRRYLPAYVLERPKSGFHVPLAEWFAGPLRPFVEQNLSADNLRRIPELNADAVRKVIDDHVNKRFDNSFKLINLLVLVQWYNTFILAPKEQ